MYEHGPTDIQVVLVHKVCRPPHHRVPLSLLTLGLHRKDTPAWTSTACVVASCCSAAFIVQHIGVFCLGCVLGQGLGNMGCLSTSTALGFEHHNPSITS